MSYNLFLDDMRDPQDARLTFQPSTRLIDLTHTDDEDWEIARSMEEFCRVLETRGLPAQVSFDHDLTDLHMRHHNFRPDDLIDYDAVTDTGWHCAQSLMCQWENEGRPAIIAYIHTSNIKGGDALANEIEPILYRG